VIALGLPVVSYAQPQIIPDPVDPPGVLEAPSIQVLLGQALFLETTLSTPTGTSCASCHDAGAAWSDPRSVLDPLLEPTSEGAQQRRFGPRNSLTTLYADRGPTLFFDAATGSWVGGRYWDGHAQDTVSQARVPFTSPVEMNNPSVHSVINKLRRSSVAPLFEQTFGLDIWHDDTRAMNAVADCLAAYQAYVTRSGFRSRFDQYLKGTATLTAQELAGKALFEGKGGCVACHASLIRSDGAAPMLTTYRYYNLGVPKNPRNPFYGMPSSINPDRAGYIDKGLGGFLGAPGEEGKFKVPTLRNVANTAPYMHNGAITTLVEAVQFLNTRDVDRYWGPPEVPANLAYGPMTPGAALGLEGGRVMPPGPGDGGGMPIRLGNLGLTPQEVEQIVAFLGSLSDEPSPAP
jgi:cytochrome c peroxidase